MATYNSRYKIKNNSGEYDKYHFETNVNQVVGLVEYMKKNFPDFAFVPNVDSMGNLTWTNKGGMKNPPAINIQGPQGINGLPGTAATISVGTVTTGNAGTNASVTNVGTTNAAKFNFAIPRGATGPQGPKGATGAQGPAGAAAIVAGSLAPNGWVKFNNGLILQWGFGKTNDVGFVNIVFPISFTSILSFCTTPTVNAEGVVWTIAIYKTLSSQSNVQIYGRHTLPECSTAANHGSFYWIALGV